MRVIIFVISLLTPISMPAHAGFVLTVPDVVLSESAAMDRMVDVDLQFSDVTSDVQATVAGWSVRVDILGAGPGTVRFPERRPNRVALTPTLETYFYRTAGDNPSGGVEAERPSIPDQPDAYTASTLIVAGLTPRGREPPIIAGEGVVRLPILIPADATGVFPIVLDPLVTAFADPSAEQIPGLILNNGSITIVPEPSAFTTLALAWAEIARRRLTSSNRRAAFGLDKQV